MSPINDSSEAVARYWESVHNASQSPNLLAAARASELLRLQQRSELFRQLLPELPPLTIDTISGGGRNLGKVDPIGGWGQGMAIRLRESRVDPFLPSSWDSSSSNLESLIWGNGHPLRRNAAGEQQRQFEADLMLLQLMVKARLHQLADDGHADSRVDLNSYGGCGAVRAALCNRLWPQALDLLNLRIPVVLVRHGRIDSADTSADPWATALPSCQGWPVLMLRQTHDPKPDPSRDAPTIRAGGRDNPVPPELWAQWCVEQQQLDAAVRKALPELMEAIEWPSGDALLVDEMPDVPALPAMPVIAAPVPTSYRVQLPVEAEGALQAVEATLRKHDAKHGTTCWETFAQLISGREQLELVPPPIDPETTATLFEQVATYLGGEAQPEDAEYLLGEMRHEWLHPEQELTEPMPEPVDLAQVIAAQFGVDPKRAEAVADRVATYLKQPASAPPLEETIERLEQLNTKIAAMNSTPPPIDPEPEPSITEQVIAAATDAVTDVIEQVGWLESASESQLRKLPDWPASKPNPRATGQRARLSREQKAVRDQAIQRLMAEGLKPVEIAEQLSPWCGQGTAAIAKRARELGAA